LQDINFRTVKQPESDAQAEPECSLFADSDDSNFCSVIDVMNQERLRKQRMLDHPADHENGHDIVEPYTEHLHFAMESTKRKTLCRSCKKSLQSGEKRVTVEWMGVFPYGERNTTAPRLYMHLDCFCNAPVEMIPPYYRAAQAQKRIQGYCDYVKHLAESRLD
jgi:hypothetical protein